MTAAVAVEPGNAPVTPRQGSDSSSGICNTVFSGSRAAELSMLTDTALEAAATAQIQEGQAVGGEQYVLNRPATAMAPAKVDTLATSLGHVSHVVEASSAASGRDQPATADLNAALGAELAAIFAQLAAEQADSSTGAASMSTEVSEAAHTTDVAAKDCGVLAVILEDNAQVVASSLAAAEPGQAAEAAAATAEERAASPFDSDSSEVHAEHLSVQTAQAAATDEGGLSLATECVSEAADDIAAGTQTSGFLPAEPAQVVSHHSAAMALTAQAELQPNAAQSSTVEAAPSAAAHFPDSFRTLERDSNADLPAVVAQHDAAAAVIWSACVASTSSPAGDNAKLDVDDAAKAFCSAELITLEEMFDPMVLLGSA